MQSFQLPHPFERRRRLSTFIIAITVARDIVNLLADRSQSQ
jgi:hypothetical protein